MARAFSICSEPGCLEPVRRGKCEEHTPKPWANTSARNRNLPSNWKKIRKDVLGRDNYNCYLCDDEATEVDHVLPVSRGGDHSERNLKAICHRCHKKKTREERN